MLVVEDEPLVALDLELGLGDAGANVCGPFAKCEPALAALADENPVDAAVLDINLGNETCEEIATRLKDRRIPYILHTGDWHAAGEVVDRLDAPIVAKPAPIKRIIDALLELRR